MTLLFVTPLPFAEFEEPVIAVVVVTAAAACAPNPPDGVGFTELFLTLFGFGEVLEISFVVVVVVPALLAFDYYTCVANGLTDDPCMFNF